MGCFFWYIVITCVSRYSYVVSKITNNVSLLAQNITRQHRYNGMNKNNNELCGVENL